MRGKFKKKTGKIIEVNVKISKVKIEGIQVKKQDGSKANVRLWPSNLQIIELNTDDKKRMKRMNKTEKSESKKEENKTKEEKK